MALILGIDRFMSEARALTNLIGFVAARLKLPALVGYLLAGVLIGPFTPGFVADAGKIASQLAEIGVMLLMFGVGLHFSLDDLLAVRGSPARRIVQMAVATAMGARVHAWGWSPLAGAGVRHLAVGGQHGGAAARAGEPGRARFSSTAASPSAGWWSRTWRWCWCWCCCRRWPRAVGAGGAIGTEALWRDIGITLLQVGVFVALMLLVGRGCSRGCCGRCRRSARASCSRCAWWPRR